MWQISRCRIRSLRVATNQNWVSHENALTPFFYINAKQTLFSLKLRYSVGESLSKSSKQKTLAQISGEPPPPLFVPIHSILYFFSSFPASLVGFWNNCLRISEFLNCRFIGVSVQNSTLYFI